MATDLAPSILTAKGELIALELQPISAEAAGEQLPEVRELLQRVRRYEGYLTEIVRSSMVERGQRERRVGTMVFELKAEAEWLVDDQAAMAQTLEVAQATGDITSEERQKAHQVIVSHRFNHTALNVLSKRVPEIDKHRKRVEGEPRLRTK